MLKSRIHRIAANLLLMLLAWTLAAQAACVAQAQELTLGTYDEGTKIFTSTDGNFQINFPERPPEEEVVTETTGPEGSRAIRGVISVATGFKFVEMKTIRIAGEEGSIGISYADVAKLESASVEEQRDVAERYFGIMKSLIGNEETKIRKRQEVKVPGTSFGVDFVAANDGSTGEARFRILISKNLLYSIFLIGQSDRMKAPEIAGFTDSFKLRNLPDGDSAETPTKSSDTAKTGLTRFTAADAGFSVLLPSEPRREESEIDDPTGRNKVRTEFISETSSGTYMVTNEPTRGFVVDKPELLDLAFQLVRDAQVERLQGELLSEKEVQVNKTVTGREYRISIPQAAGEYRTQVFLVKEQLFQVIAVGTVDFANSKQTDDVFKSFRLIDEASKSSPETALIEYSSALGGFNARLPSKPVYSRRTEKDANGIGHIQHRYLCETEDNAVLVSVTEFDGLCHNSDAQLSTMCESFVRGMAGKNKVEQFARVQSDVNAHEWTFRHTMPEPGVKVQGRVVIANDRFYIVQVIGDAAYLSDSSTNDVVQSLGVVTEVSKE